MLKACWNNRKFRIDLSLFNVNAPRLLKKKTVAISEWERKSEEEVKTNRSKKGKNIFAVASIQKVDNALLPNVFSLRLLFAFPPKQHSSTEVCRKRENEKNIFFYKTLIILELFFIQAAVFVRKTHNFEIFCAENFSHSFDSNSQSGRMK